jgi:hypothetical protein
VEVSVGLVPAAKQELIEGGEAKEPLVPERGPEPAAGLGALKGGGQRLLEPAGQLHEHGQL